MKKKQWKAAIGLVLVMLAAGGAASVIGGYLPTIGALDTPANGPVSEYYILYAKEETHADSIVTAILADYRSFVSLMEVCILFLSGVVVWMILSSKEKVEKSEITDGRHTADGKGKANFGGIILDSSFRIIVPVIMIYGVYVLFHGELSLGGGFQAGALLACAYLLDRIIPGMENRLGIIREENALTLAGAGTFAFVFTGFLPMFFGGSFLEYGRLPFPVEGELLHSIGIFMTETASGICVMAALINILEAVLERTRFDD